MTGGHKILPHIPQDDWECQCGEFAETRRDLLDHIEEERYNLTPDYRINQELNTWMRNQYPHPLVNYLQGLEVKEYVLASTELTSQEIDEAQAASKQKYTELKQRYKED